jgi:hypothetical protein
MRMFQVSLMLGHLTYCLSLRLQLSYVTNITIGAAVGCRATCGALHTSHSLLMHSGF